VEGELRLGPKAARGRSHQQERGNLGGCVSPAARPGLRYGLRRARLMDAAHALPCTEVACANVEGALEGRDTSHGEGAGHRDVVRASRGGRGGSRSTDALAAQVRRGAVRAQLDATRGRGRDDDVPSEQVLDVRVAPQAGEPDLGRGLGETLVLDEFPGRQAARAGQLAHLVLELLDALLEVEAHLLGVALKAHTRSLREATAQRPAQKSGSPLCPVPPQRPVRVSTTRLGWPASRSAAAASISAWILLRSAMSAEASDSSLRSILIATS